jgi:hypothetical protein
LQSGVHSSDFGNKEPISVLWDGLDVSRILGVVVQRLPELANRYAEAAIEIDERIAGPEATSKFLATDDFSGVFQQHEEELIGLLLQPDASSVLEEFCRGGVYLKRAELIDNSGLCLHTWPPKS